MGRDDDISHAPERIVGRQRLGLEDIEGGPLQPAAAQRLDQGGLLHHPAAGDIDQHRPGLEAGEGRRIYQAAGLGRERHADHEEIRLRQQLAQTRDRLDAVDRGGGRGARAEANDLHAMGLGQTGDGLAGLAEAQDQDRPALQGGDGAGRPAPLALGGREAGEAQVEM